MPTYQRRYTGDRYPRGEQQQKLHNKSCRGAPRDKVVLQRQQRAPQGHEQQRAPERQRGHEQNRRIKTIKSVDRGTIMVRIKATARTKTRDGAGNRLILRGCVS